MLANLNGSVDSKGLATLLNRGKSIRPLPTGKYRFTITDKNPKAGFSILGPKSTKVSALTGTGFVGRKTVTLNLARRAVGVLLERRQADDVRGH